MKFIKLLILVLLPMCFSMESAAQVKNSDKATYFSHLRKDSSSEYAYMSPMMLKSMNLTDKDLEGFPAKKIKMIEILKLKFNADKLTKSAIEKCVNDNNMELMGATYNNNVKNEIYVTMKGNTITNLLILKWGAWYGSVKLLYIVGDLSSEDIKDKL